MHHLQRTLVTLLLATGAVVVFVGCDAPETFEAEALEGTAEATPFPSAPAGDADHEPYTADTPELEHRAGADPDGAQAEDPELGEPDPVDSEPIDPEPAEEEEPLIETLPGTEPAPAMAYEGSEPVMWSPSGTLPIPSYGYQCRYMTDAVLEMPSNGYYDDTLFLDSVASDDADVTIEVREGTHTWLTAMVDFTRGLKAKSWRDAIGIAVWRVPGEPPVEANVVDGTLCFNAKLQPGQAVLAEFSLILDVDGTYVATGGNVWVPGEAVSGLTDLAVDADLAVDVDLR